MERKAQKKYSQQVLNFKNRHARFISEYVLRKHPQLYAEADAFHNQLRAANPGKRDLTKTHEFLIKTTKYTDYRDFYSRKKLKVHRQQTVTTTTTTTTNHENNMELNIELLTPEVVKENTSSLSQTIPDQVYQDLLREIEKDPNLQAILDDMVSPASVDGNVDEQAPASVDGNVDEQAPASVDGNVDEQPLDRVVQESLQETPLERELHSLF